VSLGLDETKQQLLDLLKEHLTISVDNEHIERGGYFNIIRVKVSFDGEVIAVDSDSFKVN